MSDPTGPTDVGARVCYRIVTVLLQPCAVVYRQAAPFFDAGLKIKKPFDTSLVSVELHRAKIDVSRTQTVKSACVIAYDRPLVSDCAAQFLSAARSHSGGSGRVSGQAPEGRIQVDWLGEQLENRSLGGSICMAKGCS